ncbi:hypothetical protein [Mycolicibacterium arseniciresistens]|uniref:Uncharacterized protein n=1 Tax=Mycolicibacterium arseniciresistens TaxID=3062257 RepID=A0ABT8UNH0_9MYCO|nr:hypothetical protein [Mycolicibacterium arseniciresistens]MDO3639332.1 hypothetical protein [Mycolicibacterium arseniciresistens]
MTNLTSRYGNSLLALTTLRPPDRDRGKGVVHLAVPLPSVIGLQIDRWHSGGRGPVTPGEAATLLWDTSVAGFLNGRVDAWLDVPGVRDLLPGLTALTGMDQAGWPVDQSDLQEFVANAAPGSPTWRTLARSLTDAVDLLGELVLIFKYAAIRQQRDIRTAAELYRLVRTLTATSGPGTRDGVIGWLSAPLVIPRAFTALPDPSGPRPPTPAPPPLPPPPLHPRIDLTSVDASAALGRLAGELTRIEQDQRATSLDTALRDAGVSDRQVRARISNEALGERTTHGLAVSGQPSTEPPTARLAIYQPPASRRTQIVRLHLYGVPILLDIAAGRGRSERVRRELGRRIIEELPESLRTRLAGAGVALEDLTVWPDLLASAIHSPSFLEPIGRSDLLLVRQTTTGYRRAEIAYVENILVGETRARTHTNRLLTRQEFFEAVERETEETRDLQVTDKAELNREISKIVNEDLRAQGSFQLTSRGPTQVVVSADVSHVDSTEEAAKNAESYARETVERAVKRTLERVTRETRTMFEQETTEVNSHNFKRESTADDHVSGVYQYLERVSRAKMFWYGEREMYDLLIPEPAALLWQLALSRQELQIPIEAPDADLFATVTLANIASKREELIRAFRVTDMPPALADTRETSTSFPATGGGNDAKYATGKELQIPEGYEVTGATFVASAETEGGDPPNGGVTIAGQVQLWLMSAPPPNHHGSVTHEFTFAPPLPGPAVSVAVHADNFTSLAGSITLRMNLTETAREAWALAAYGRVAERYEQLRLEYAQAVIQASANQPAETVSLPAGSRLALHGIVRGELQRAAIDIMRNAAVDFDLIAPYPFASEDGTLGTHASVDIDALHAAEPEARFLQQAFEWEHLAWIVYPYFWGRRSEWSRTVVVSHPDPDFASFLNAGAARVQIPVRPGFEDLVKHYMETGEVYEGGGLPKMGDAGYVAFIDEQLTTLGAPGDEVAWPPDAPREWDIVAPTALLLARSLQKPQLPSWDPQTGNEV